MFSFTNADLTLMLLLCRWLCRGVVDMNGKILLPIHSRILPARTHFRHPQSEQIIKQTSSVAQTQMNKRG